MQVQRITSSSFDETLISKRLPSRLAGLLLPLLISACSGGDTVGSSPDDVGVTADATVDGSSEVGDDVGTEPDALPDAVEDPTDVRTDTADDVEADAGNDAVVEDAGSDPDVDSDAPDGGDTDASDADADAPEPADCGDVPHGESEERECFESAAVAFGEVCVSTTQTRTCDDGAFAPDFDECEFLACEVLPPSDCGETAHEGTEERICFHAASVAFDEECTATTQTRTCFDGAFAPDFPDCEFLACEVLPPSDCGETAHEGTEERACFHAAAVPFGEECQATTQSRTCVDGAFAPDFPECDFLDCEVLPPSDCGETGHEGTEERACFDAASVAFDEECAATTQTRTCFDGAFAPDFPECDFLSCEVLAPGGCGDLAHDETEERTCFVAPTVPFGEACEPLTQSRTCRDGEFEPDFPACEFLTCEVLPPAACDETEHEGVEERSCFDAATVPFGEECTSTTQSRTCADGEFEPDYPACDFLSCEVLPPSDCGETAHDATEERPCFEEASVPFGETCESTVQSRTCSDGEFAPDFPSCDFLECEVLPPADCGDTGHGESEERVCYANATVPFGETCEPVLQSRTCSDGDFEPDFPSCDFLECEVLPPSDCGETNHGESEERDCYANATVPFGETCSPTTQSRTCFDGEFAPDFPVCDFLECEVEPAASCGDTPHGADELRECWDASSVPYGSACTSTIQARTCSNGEFDPDYPSCEFLTCEVEPPLDCPDAEHGATEERERYAVTSVASGDTCPMEVQTRSCDNGDWTDWNGTFTELSCTFCGDGVVDANETCDDGDALDCGTCSADCQGDGTSLPCDFVSIAVGYDYSCALAPNGYATCWGSGTAAPASTAYSSIAAGDSFACAIRESDGTIDCWGSNLDGQADPPDGVFAEVAAGQDHACATDSAGRPTCWGDDFFGATEPPRFARYTQITGGAYHSCGLISTDAARCWGSNNFGQRSSPSGVFTSINAGAIHNCGVRPTGEGWCWGYDGHGRRSVPPGSIFRRLSAGGWHSCGVLIDSSAVCFGRNTDGVSTPPGGQFRDVQAGELHSCGLRFDGTIECWGANGSGQATPP